MIFRSYHSRTWHRIERSVGVDSVTCVLLLVKYKYSVYLPGIVNYLPRTKDGGVLLAVLKLRRGPPVLLRNETLSIFWDHFSRIHSLSVFVGGFPLVDPGFLVGVVESEPVPVFPPFFTPFRDV